MPTMTASKHFQAPPEVVFDHLTDLELAAAQISSIVRIEKLTDGPVGAGTRFRETRVMFGKEATEEMEITAFDRGRSFTVECDSCGAHYVVHHVLRHEGDGTTVDVQFQMRPLTVFAKLMTPVGKLMAKSCMKAFDKDLEEMRTVIEGPSAAVSTA